MKQHAWKVVAVLLTALIGLFTWTANSVVADNAREHSLFDQKFDKIQDQILTLMQMQSNNEGRWQQLNPQGIDAKLELIQADVSRLKTLIEVTK